jgi:hypothetical protein
VAQPRSHRRPTGCDEFNAEPSEHPHATRSPFRACSSGYDLNGSSRLHLPGKRKEPLTDASHVRNALARFDQVQGGTDAERDRAFANIRAAAGHLDVDIAEDDWRQLGKQPHTDNPAH